MDVVLPLSLYNTWHVFDPFATKTRLEDQLVDSWHACVLDATSIVIKDDNNLDYKLVGAKVSLGSVRTWRFREVNRSVGWR
jgi:hypothetical protein